IVIVQAQDGEGYLNMLFNKVIRYFKRRRCNTSELIEINELILKAARRQNYDLGHLISYLGDGNDPKLLSFIREKSCSS
ncbi:hypothetical protein ACLBP5_30490, partial [Klebsiella pneumoniae]